MARRRMNPTENKAELSTDGNSIEKSINENESKTMNTFGHSGDSDDDLRVDVSVDTTSIGFAILRSLLATGQMTNEQFQIAVKKLEELTNRKYGNFLDRDVNNITNARLLHLNRK